MTYLAFNKNNVYILTAVPLVYTPGLLNLNSAHQQKLLDSSVKDVLSLLQEEDICRMRLEQ